MDNLDTIFSNGHQISFEITEGENGSKQINAILDRTVKIISAEISKLGEILYSNKKGLKGTRIQEKKIIGGVATKETGPINSGKEKVGMFERYQTKSGNDNEVIKNVLSFDNGLKIEEENTFRGENNQSYTKKVNGITAFSMVKTKDGIVLTRYDREGNKLIDFSYDKNGRPIGNNATNFPGVPRL